MMTLDDLKKNIDLYSADLSRWPAERIRPAHALIESDARARAYYEREVRMDDALRLYQPVAGNMDLLQAKIMKSLHAPAAETKARPFSHPAFLAAPLGGGLIAAMVVGFMIGVTPPSPVETSLDDIFYSQQQILSDDATLMTEEAFLDDNQ